MAQCYDEELSAAIPEPALDPKNELMVQKKATFCDNLAQGKMRWQTLKSWHFGTANNKRRVDGSRRGARAHSFGQVSSLGV